MIPGTRSIQQANPRDGPIVKDPRRQALELFARQYGGARERSRLRLMVTPSESDKSFAVNMLGGFNNRYERELIVTAPATVDGSLIAVTRGMTLNCHWFNASMAFKFNGVITKVVFEPQPLLYLRLAEQTYYRSMRTVPRALVSLPGIVRLPAIETVLLVDVSITGARVATIDDAPLFAGQDLELAIKPKLDIDVDTTLTLRCTIVGNAEPAPAQFSGIVFRGLKFNDVTPEQKILLHAYVQQSLVSEMDTLAQILMSARDTREMKE
jgi:hypothetical protein